jgi:hypothetical protein
MLLAAVDDGASVSRKAGPTQRQLAEGILVQPGAGDLEPPSVADEQDDDYDDGQDGNGVGSAPPPPAYESRQEQMERPGARQLDTERGDARQEDLEMPNGPGQKY